MVGDLRRFQCKKWLCPIIPVDPTYKLHLFPSLNASTTRRSQDPMLSDHVYVSLMYPVPIFASLWSFAATETWYEIKNRDWLHKAQIPPFSNTSNPFATRTTSTTGLHEPVSTQFKDQHSTPPMCESGFVITCCM